MISKYSARAMLLITATTLIGCADTQYGGYPTYPNYPTQQYPNSGRYPNYPPPQYPPSYPYGGYPNNNQAPQYPYGYPRYDHNDNDHRHDHNHGSNNNRPPPPPPPPPKPVGQIIKPACPPGTNYDGRSCIITDNSLKKPGGDGRINPCPKGMWNSGGTCIKDR